MKTLTILLLATGFLSFNHTSAFRQQRERGCGEMLDSADALAGSGSFSIRWEPRKPNEDRELRLSRWFEQRSFSELRCLLESPNKLYALYGYMYAGSRFPDSLGRYAFLLSDTTSMQYYTPRGLVDMKTTVGNFLQKQQDQINKDHQDMNKRPEVEEKVQAFIKQYASQPGTYKPVSFPLFTLITGEYGSASFSIRHRYFIRDNKGRVAEVTSEFVLDPALTINVIEQDSTKYVSSYPPRLSQWLGRFGRPLNGSDSVALKLN